MYLTLNFSGELIEDQVTDSPGNLDCTCCRPETLQSPNQPSDRQFLNSASWQ